MSKPSDQTIPFNPSALGSLGVEMEWLTVDQKTGAQIPAAPAVLSSFDETPRIKPELFTSTIEINTGINQQTEACVTELAEYYKLVCIPLQQQGGALLSTGTHPFSHWQDQEISNDPRYHRLVERLQWTARRFNIFGIHVHIGMPDGDTCIAAMNRLLPVIGVFLAISANSPFWRGHDTGLASSRIKIFEGLSQGGMPFYFEHWQDFEHCICRLLATGSIDSVRDIWWEMRPHPDFGTLEIRIGDMPVCQADTMAYVAYVRAEVLAAVKTETNENRVHPSLIRENRWRACRYGMLATIIDPQSESLMPVLQWLERRLDTLADNGADAEDLNIVKQRLPYWQQQGDGAALQRKLFASYPNQADMVHALMAQDGWHENDG
ncbi:MAG: YbdK family carboxylate-amine ligase [Mariprofundaceae bacterium]